MARKKLLIVDDEKLVHDVVVRALKRDIDITNKLSAEEALDDLEDELERGAFDVVLLDVRMPGVPDGIDFFRHLQRIDASSERCRGRVVFQSAPRPASCCSICRSTASSPIVDARAAAIFSASATPSSRRHRRSIVGYSSGVSVSPDISMQ